MSMRALTRYRNLKHLSQEEWLNLDIHLFIAANFNRYCNLLIKKIGYQHLPSDAMESLLSLYCLVAFKPLTSVHARHLDAEGERRNQIMLGTLKMISMTRMIDAVINEFPAYLSLDQMGHAAQAATHDNTTLSRHHLWVTGSNGGFCDIYNTEPNSETEYDTQEQAQHRSTMLELMRHELTVSQYHVMRYLICDQLDIQQIALLTDTSQTNIRIMLLNVRRRLFELLPAEVASEFEDCLYRN